LDESIYCVYKHTAPNGKIYIGITSQKPKNRFKGGKGYYHNEHFKHAILSYGWENIKHEILANGLNREEAIIEEKRLIAFYNSTNFKRGYNLMTGGDGIGTHTKSTLKKLREINLGKKWTEEQKEKQRQRLLGHTLSEESRNRLHDMRVGPNNPFYGRKHSEDSKRRIKEHAADFNGEKSVNAKAVIQLSLDGSVIAQFGAISTAAKENGIPNPYNITACCRGKLKTAYGYIWRYADESISNEVLFSCENVR
jgi:group I intron endonuclease